MNTSQLFGKASRFITDNSPALLTAVGVTGTITTALLAAKASFVASDALSNARFEKRETSSEPLTVKEKVKLVWPLYIAPVSSGCLTISAIIFANRIGTRRAAAMAAAYSLSEKAFSEYKDKVVEHIGQNEETKVREEIAQDRVKESPVNNREVIIAGSGDVLCFETHTGRYFESSMEELKKAQNDTNYQLLNESYASLGDLQRRMGLSVTDVSEDVGWSANSKVEMDMHPVMSDDGRPCIAVSYVYQPIRGYYKGHQ